MNTSLKDQIKAIQIVTDFVKRETFSGIIHKGVNITPALNDAASTIAALNLNPDIFEKVKSLESQVSKLMIRNSELSSKIQQLRSEDKDFGQYVQKNIGLESQVKELREAGNALIEAMNQYSFFADGYRNGSASLAEFIKASEDQHAAYSKMFDVLKSLNKQP